MIIIGVDFHPAFQQIASVDIETGDFQERQLTHREEAENLLEDRFPQIWVPSWKNRDMRQLLWHRHRMVQARTWVMNQLQAVALNEGLRCKKRLWREAGRKQLEAFPLAPWASRRRGDLKMKSYRQILEFLLGLYTAILNSPFD